MLLGAVAAQEKCCTPHQWEATVDTAAGMVRGYETPVLFEGVARVHYDATGKRVASTYGAGTNKLAVQGWEYYERDGVHRYFHVSGGCIPVNSVHSEVARDTLRDSSFIAMYAYHNVTPGIKNETV